MAKSLLPNHMCDGGVLPVVSPRNNTSLCFLQSAHILVERTELLDGTLDEGTPPQR